MFSRLFLILNSALYIVTVDLESCDCLYIVTVDLESCDCLYIVTVDLES